jgi:hypothetical protein
MKSRFSRFTRACIGLVLLTVLLSLASLSPGHAQDDTTSSFALDDLTFAGFDTFPLLAGPRSTGALLAPNGQHFLHTTRETLCLYGVDGEPRGCASLEIDGDMLDVDIEGIRWSPDSTRVVFTGPGLRSLQDTDIMLLDTTTMTLTNLTDDGYAGSLTRVEPSVRVDFDLSPQWSADGTRLAFIRYPLEGSFFEIDAPISFDLCILTLSTGEITCRQPLPALETVGVYHLVWLPDGDTFVFNVENRLNIPGGIYRYSWTQDQPAEQLVSTPFAVELSSRDAERFEVRYAWPIAASPDGSAVLVSTPEAQQAFTPIRDVEASAWRVLDLETGELRLIDDERMVTNAGWLPTGGIVYTAYPVFETPAESFSVETRGFSADLYAVGPEGGESVLLAMPEDVVNSVTTDGIRWYAPSPSQQQPLAWTAANTTLLATIDETLYLLRFELRG